MHPILQPIAAITGPINFEAAPVLGRFRRRELARGEAWLREGEVCRHLCFVESGLLRHTRASDEGVLTRWATLPGQFALNFTSFTRATPAEEGIEATEASVLYELDRDVWAELRRDYPQLQSFWVMTLEYLITCYEDRVWSLVSNDAEHRYRYMMERYPEFLLQLPQHFVADMLGIAPRHLSRVRAALADSGR